MQIDRFSDKEIEELVRNCLGILNSRYLEKIVRIAEGNARMAVLAGKVAIEANRLDSINDASQLYDDYYGRYLSENNVLKENRKLCATAGIIAFLSALHLEHLDAVLPLFDYVQMSVEEFKMNTDLLHNLEIVDVYNDKAVHFSEQCLSNYLLKYVFVDLKIIPLSHIISVCYNVHKERVVNAVNTLFNIFQSKDMHDTVLKSLQEIWSDLKKSNDPNFFLFVKTFYMINPVETLIMLKERIDAEAAVDFDIEQIDFEKQKNRQSVESDVIQILCGYANMTELPSSLDLLFDYFARRKDLFMEFYHGLSGKLGVRRDSEKYGYYTQIQLVKKFIERANEWTDHAICILFIHIAKDLLQLIHQPTEGGRNRTIVFYTIPIQYSEGAVEYRKLIWTALTALSKNPLYHNEVKSIIEDYGHVMLDEIDIEIVEFDIEYIMQLCSVSFSSENLHDCITINALSETIIRLELGNCIDFTRFLTNRKYSIYTLLKGKRHHEGVDYKKEEELKRQAISKYMISADLYAIREMFGVCACIAPDNTRDAYELKNGLATVFTELEGNANLYLGAVDCYLALGAPLELHPHQIMEKLFKILSESDVYSLLTKYEYSSKNTWVYYFFYCLPESKITQQHISKLYEFFANREDGIKQSPYRMLDFLDKYKKADEDVFIECCRIILRKMEYSPFMVSIYFGLLFNSHANPPENVINKFNGQYALLAKVYMATLSSDNDADYEGDFLLAFYFEYPTILEIYVKHMLSEEWRHYDYDERRLMVLWTIDNYLDVFNQAAQIILENTDELYWSKAATYLKAILSQKSNSADIIHRQDEWLIRYVSTHSNDERKMYLLFTAISAFPSERRKPCILHFIKVNPSFDAFKKLPLEESVWGGLGSMIPHMEAQIAFLENLLPYFVGLHYLPHKQKVIEDIKRWKLQIENEQIEEMLRG